MAISQQALANIINHNAGTLCSKQGDKILNEYQTGNSNRFGDMNPNDYHDDWDNFSFSDDTQMVNEGMVTPSMQYNSQSVQNSNMPEAIKRSMIQNQINVQSEMQSLAEMAKKQSGRNRPVMTETGNTNGSNNGIDYTILKGLIKECLAEYFKSNPLPLNENNIKSIGMSDSKIKVVKENGDIYGGKLTYMGNVDDKKK